MRKRKNQMFATILSLVILSSIIISVFNVRAESPTDTSVSQDFTIVQSGVTTFDSSETNDIFQMNITIPSKSYTTTDVYSIKYSLKVKASPNRTLTGLTLIQDYMYYDFNNSGSNHRSTAMIWDNNSNSWRLPSPWVVSDTETVDTSASVSSADGVKVYFTDLTPGQAKVSDLIYIPKSSITDVTTDSDATVAGINQTGFNLQAASVVPLDANLAGLSYVIDSSTLGTTIDKTLRLTQEKIVGFGGLWYAFNFVPTAKYTYEFNGNVSAINPTAILDAMDGQAVQFSAPVTTTAPYSMNCDYIWQQSTDGGQTYTDMPGQTSTDLNFNATATDSGNLYRLKITPQNTVDGSSLYTQGAELTVSPPTPVVGGDITVQYVDETQAELASPMVLKGNVNDEYTTSPTAIDGYELGALPTNANGTFTTEPQIVTYVYQKKAIAPTVTPTTTPTAIPTTPANISNNTPTNTPTTAPTTPTAAPTVVPTTSPTSAPSAKPTVAPTTTPTVAPITNPTTAPTTTTPAPSVKGAVKITKTGENDTLLYTVSGSVLLGLGMAVLILMKKSKKSPNNG